MFSTFLYRQDCVALMAAAFVLGFAPTVAIADALTPKEELATFKVLPGFKVELVASEPDIIDPVSMAFDERGRLLVCEMRGYPNGGVATGKQTMGRIRVLTDEEGDGVYKKSAVLMEHLRFPTGIVPWKNGVIVAVAPDIYYFEDTDGDGKADTGRILYTGFGLDNIQQIVNSLQWGIDNWVYAVCGSTGGTITSPEARDMKPLTLRGRGIRFKPDVPGSLEPTSGGGQYGLTCDAAQHWFTATNSQHLRQIVLPDHYLRKNPYLTVPAVTADIPEHGAACRVFRISPFEPWRVERTTRRKAGPEAKNLPATELVPGGYITSACSPVYYNDPLFPEAFRESVYVCDPANNLITRDELAPNGSLYTARRADRDVEFLASTDPWFRPVHLTVGPDGALYVLDFYREVIETPISLPDDIKKKLNLESRGRGRIWRIVPEGFQHKPLPRLDKATTVELVKTLADDHVSTRYTAQRLLYERHDKDAVAAAGAALATASPAGKPHLLWTLHALAGLDAKQVLAALRDPSPVVREHGLRLAESFLEKDESLQAQVAAMADDPDRFVRLQLAFSASFLPGETAGPVLTKLLRQPSADVWLQTAVLSASKDVAPVLLEALAADPELALASGTMVSRLAAIVGAEGDPARTARVLKLFAAAESPGLQHTLLEGLGQGMRLSSRALSKIWDDPPADLKSAVEQARGVFEKAAAIAENESATTAERASALRFIAVGPFKTASEALTKLLSPRSSAELQSAALRALAGFDNPAVAERILAGWDGYGPTLRREAIETLFARKDRLEKLLEAIEANKVFASHIPTARADALRKHSDPWVRRRATKLLADQIAADRQKVIDDYRDAVTGKGDLARGREVFRKNCTACHKLENTGYEVGASLTAALKNKTRATLLIDILDPSREVDTRYVNYQVTTTAGRSLSGILSVETPTSVTLLRGEKAEDTILRNQIDEIRATNKSLMPDEFEKQIDKKQMADLLEYLMGVVK